jgi:hypothetical protein
VSRTSEFHKLKQNIKSLSLRGKCTKNVRGDREGRGTHVWITLRHESGETSIDPADITHGGMEKTAEREPSQFSFAI